MKKAIVDQMLLGLFLFVCLIAIGATVSDNMQARDKFYNLKKITDNSVLTLAKYYTHVDENTTDAESTNYNMLSETKLGLEVRDNITYTWDFVSEPNTVTATIANYEEETFWFKFLGLDSFALKAESRATVTTFDTSDPTTTVSYGFSPFAINDRTFTIGESIEMNYALTANWQYSDQDTFYPVFPNCDCDCDFMLSNQFDFSDLGFDMENCDNTTSGCSTKGESDFVQYANSVGDIYNSEYNINFENGRTDTPLCLAGTYLGTDISTWNTQINHLSNGIEDIVGSGGANLPLDMDIITLDDGAIANGIVRVRVTGYTVKATGQSNTRFITLDTVVVPAKDKEIELEY